MKGTGLAIGFIIGFIAGFGLLNQLKKSQRTKAITASIVGVSVIIFGASGYAIGSNMDRRIQIEKDLGHDKLKENIVQQGRVWVAITQWTDKHGTEYTLITGQAANKTLIPQLNDKLVYNHEIQSGSNANVSKYHLLARNQVFESQRSLYK